MTHAQAIALSTDLYKMGAGHLLGVDPHTGFCSIEMTTIALPEPELLRLVEVVHDNGCTLELSGGTVRILRT
jgi:hypothetical protein